MMYSRGNGTLLGRIAGGRAKVGIFIAACLASAAGAGLFLVPGSAQQAAGVNHRAIDKKISALLAGIPQHGNTLGSPTAPMTLQVFGDLQCAVVRWWFVEGQLSGIIEKFVRTNVLKLEYRAMKTDTLNRRTFVVQQTAALAAGAQDRMWNFLETFYYEQGREYTPYVTEEYLDGIARQVPGLELAPWDQTRTASLARSVIGDDHTAYFTRKFYNTPSFLIGRTGGPLHFLTGRTPYVFLKWKFRRAPNGEPIAPERPIGYSRPLYLVDSVDIKKAVEEEI
jgi:Thioredoxin